MTPDDLNGPAVRARSRRPRQPPVAIRRAQVLLSIVLAAGFAFLALAQALAGHPTSAAFMALVSVQFLAFVQYCREAARGVPRRALVLFLVVPGDAKLHGTGGLVGGRVTDRARIPRSRNWLFGHSVGVRLAG